MVFLLFLSLLICLVRRFFCRKGDREDGLALKIVRDLVSL